MIEIYEIITDLQNNGVHSQWWNFVEENGPLIKTRWRKKQICILCKKEIKLSAYIQDNYGILLLFCQICQAKRRNKK